MNPTNDQALERVRPEQAGVLPGSILAFLDDIRDKDVNLHSFMLLRHGKVAAEGYCKPYEAGHLHPIFSVSKSVTSAALGIAIGEGLLTLDDRIVDFFPEKLAGDVHPYTAMMTIRDLLMMATVHPKSTDTKIDDWVRGFLNTPPSHPPGTSFAYDTTGTHTLCAILQKVTGLALHDYLKPRLFEPLGFGEIEWETCALNINKGGSGIRCTTEDMARFGQLYLQDGVWNGKRILPEGWVVESTGKRIDTSNARMLLDGKRGYGYQFWRVRHHAYCAFGMGGQLVVVLPERDAVFISTANTMLCKDGQQQILDSFWQTLYPGLVDGPVDEAPEVYAGLQERLSRLTMYIPEGMGASTAAMQVSGVRYRLDANPSGFEAMEFVTGDKGSALRFYENEEAAVELLFGVNGWEPGRDPFYGLEVVSAGVWTDARTCVLHSQSIYPLQLFVLTCSFGDGWVSLHLVPAGALVNDAEVYFSGRI